MQAPEWGHPVYTSRVTSGQVAGVLDISPDTLHAMDRCDNNNINNNNNNKQIHTLTFLTLT